jgi:5-methylcytosine-specific restriction protein A
MMALKETLQRVLTDYPTSKDKPLENDPLARYIRQEVGTTVSAALGSDSAGLVVQGPGQGTWAAVPWIGIFDPAITTSATEGYYVVYLFHAQQPIVHLSLNQGTTAVREEFGAKARDVLSDRAEFMRKRLADYKENLSVNVIDLGSIARLPGDYAAGHAIGATYHLHTLPDETILERDLRNIVRAYRALTYRGGIEGDIEPQSELTTEFNFPLKRLLRKRVSTVITERLNATVQRQRTLRNFTAPPVRLANCSSSNAMDQSEKGSSKHTTSKPLDLWRRDCRSDMTLRLILRCCAPTVIE